MTAQEVIASLCSVPPSPIAKTAADPLSRDGRYTFAHNINIIWLGLDLVRCDLESRWNLMNLLLSRKDLTCDSVPSQYLYGITFTYYAVTRSHITMLQFISFITAQTTFTRHDLSDKISLFVPMCWESLRGYLGSSQRVYELRIVW